MPPRIVGHRGAAAVAPENTLPAFRRAVELGLRAVELDVRLTRDGVPVCFHDDRLERVTPERGRVADWDWAPLSAVPVLPGAFRGAYPDARIPLLETVLRDLPGDCRFLVELKPEPARGDDLVRRTLDVVRETGALARCRFISFDQELLRTLARELPLEVSEGRVEAVRALGILAGARDALTLVPRARQVGAEALHPHHTSIDADLVRSAREEGFLISAWTVNTPEEVRRLVLLGVGEITTDDPETVLGALGA